MEGARNMARDHALADALAPDQAVLRIYRWARPTISFGRNEPARGLYDLGAAARGGFRFVRRPSGGRVVLHDRELTYSVLLPVTAVGGPKRAYASVNAGLARALRALGVRAQLATGEGRQDRLTAGPCFQRPAAGEVTVAGRKVVGSAQVRIAGALLQHGSLLIGAGQERLAALRLTGAERFGSSQEPVSLEELLERVPSWVDLEGAVRQALEEELGGDWSHREAPAVERASEARHLRRYTSDEWTWRR
jgi:lipoate-protein ligase A